MCARSSIIFVLLANTPTFYECIVSLRLISDIVKKLYVFIGERAVPLSILHRPYYMYFMHCSLLSALIVVSGLLHTSVSLAGSLSNPSLNSLRPITVYKRESCGCCGGWVEHLEQAGMKTRIKHPENLDALKKEFGISPQYQACHTGVKQGYVFEGHVPVDVIQNFLSGPPSDSIGLAVPGMPFGSPGMEASGKNFRPYDVLLLKKSGGSVPYAKISPAGTEYIFVK
jgi:hypothetical protein